MFKIKKLENFAVIKSLEDVLELKDLTIFMGDNSAGKSYLAMLIHSFVTMSKGYSETDFLKAITSKFKDTTFLKNLKKSIEIIIDNESNNLVLSFEDADILELKDIINFSINDYLIKKYLTFTLFEKHNLNEIEIELNNLDKVLPKMLLITNVDKNERKVIEFIIDNDSKISTSFQGNTAKKTILDIVLQTLISGLIEITIKRTLPINSVYLPASRTGFLQTYKALSNDAIMSNFSNKKNEEKHTLSVIIRFFITQLNTATSFEENKFAEFIENFIMNGKVDIYQDSNEIEFKLKDGSKLDLNYLSSTVSELIPLVVFLKRGIIKRDGLLVIEEPEAHLSFKNQRLVAKLIASLLQNKIKVLITTHSDFLIYELNNLIMRNEILKNKNKLTDVEFNFDDKIAIDYKKVSLYNFILHEDKSTISRIKINRSGIKSKYIFDNTYNITKEKNQLLDIMDIIDADN
jgi:predicted ATPase